MQEMSLLQSSELWSVHDGKTTGGGGSFTTVHSVRFAGQTNVSTSGSGGIPGNSPSLAQLPAEHVLCSVPPPPEFETKFG